MQRVLVLCAFIGATSAASAGVYLPAEEGELLTYSPRLLTFEETRKHLQDLGTKRADIDQKQVKENDEVAQLRRRYNDQIRALEQKQTDGTLTILDRVNLSGYYLRLFGPGNDRSAQLAIDVLTRGGRTPINTHNFMVLSNLATALSLRYPGDAEVLTMAYEYLKEALDVWPTVTGDFPDKLSDEMLSWYYRADKLELDLLRVRRMELEERQQPTTVDNLFPGLAARMVQGIRGGALAA